MGLTLRIRQLIRGRPWIFPNNGDPFTSHEVVKKSKKGNNIVGEIFHDCQIHSDIFLESCTQNRKMSSFYACVFICTCTLVYIYIYILVR